LGNLEILEEIARMRFIPEKDIKTLENLQSKIKNELRKIATVKEEVGS